MTIFAPTQTIVSHWLPQLIAGITVFLLFYVLAQLSKRLILRLAKNSNPNKAYALGWIGQSAKIIFIAIGLISAAAAMGLDVSALVASLGLTGVAAGFAMKESLTNFVAGTLVLIHPPFHVGDVIKVAGFEGEVVAVNMRYTFLLNAGETILIPNMTLLASPIIISKPEKI